MSQIRFTFIKLINLNMKPKGYYLTVLSGSSNIFANCIIKKKILILILSSSWLIFIVTLSCSNQHHKSESVTEKVVIDPKSNHKVNLSEVIEVVDLIFFETNENCLFNNIDKLRYYNGRFYMYEQFGSRQALCFSDKGRFLFKIGAIGHAENEYITLRDLNINQWKDRIEIYDINRDLIQYYDFSGKYIGKGSIGRKTRHYAVIDSLHYAFFNDGEYDDLPYNIFITPQDRFKVMHPGVPFQGDRDIMNNVNPFYESENGVLFAFSLNDTIFSVTSQGAQPKYILDFGKERIPKEVLGKDMKDIVEVFRGNTVPGFVSHLVENPEYISVSYSYQIPNANTVFISKDKLDVLNLFEPVNDINYLPFKPPYCTMGDFFVSVIPAYEILDTYREKEMQYQRLPESINIEAYTSLKNIAGKINENDNPVLMIYKIKNL